MNRIYKALVWLAGSAIIFGLAFAIMLTMQTVSNYARVPHLSTIDGLFSGMITGLYGISVYSSLKTVAFLLVSGATVLAVALAWADRRYGWLLALIIVSVVALLCPTFIDGWVLLSSQPLSLLQPPASVPASVEVATFTAYAAPLVAVVLALVLALTHRERAAQTTP